MKAIVRSVLVLAVLALPMVVMAATTVQPTVKTAVAAAPAARTTTSTPVLTAPAVTIPKAVATPAPVPQQAVDVMKAQAENDFIFGCDDLKPANVSFRFGQACFYKGHDGVIGDKISVVGHVEGFPYDSPAFKNGNVVPLHIRAIYGTANFWDAKPFKRTYDMCTIVTDRGMNESSNFFQFESHEPLPPDQSKDPYSFELVIIMDGLVQPSAIKCTSFKVVPQLSDLAHQHDNCVVDAYEGVCPVFVQ